MGPWNKVANLLGVGHRDETDGNAIRHQNIWLERRKRLLARRCGRLNCPDECQTGTEVSVGENKDSNGRHIKRSPSPGEIHRHKRSHFPEDVSVPDVDIEIKLTGGRNNITCSLDIDPIKQTESPADVQPPLTSSYVKRTHASILTRTNSDTAIASATGKARPLYPSIHIDKNNLQYGSYDFTDFDARESITKLLNDVLSRHEPKRLFGMGLVGRLLSRKFRKDLSHAQKDAIYSFNDHRPYFTYWVTTVQILIMIITLVTYGFGPFGMDRTLVTGTVSLPSSVQHEGFYEQQNIWLGPRPLDLIHLGAKFTPCMRRDSLVYKEILHDRNEERKTGCCIAKDLSGCMQTTKDACSSANLWQSWNDTSQATDSSPKGRRSGPVCGQDPQYCLSPASTHPHEWPDDITQWPICHEHTSTTRQYHHMSCEVIARPCCIGIYGQCRLTTSEHCQFLRGSFHPEARLCSQVSCMEDVCGLVPFYARDYPDQFYRLFTALFLHAGLIHLAFTVILQHYVMRDIERLLGSTRMAIIYILPGIAGNIASATFVPYHSQVGPSGSQFALLACLMAETINSWHLLEDPGTSLYKLVSISIGLFIAGLLPWIDNYAHIFGFFVGLLLSLALTPYLTPFNDAYSRRIKVIQIWVCLVLVGITFIILPLPLYAFPFYKCSWCQYLDCLPLAPHWCENQDIKVSRLDIF